MKHALAIISFFLFNIVNCNATVCEVTSSGDWNDNSIWSCGNAPSSENCVDTIIIGEYTSLNINVDLSTCPPVVLIVQDTLFFETSKKITLPAGSVFINSVGGFLVPESLSGANSQLKIGNDKIWQANDGTLIGGNVLDIELVEFFATPLERRINLSWITASEINNDFFTIERSLDGINFTNIGNMDGAGNSSSLLNYSFTDFSILSGYVYYRLKQTDFDGSITASNIIKANILDDGKYKIIPNPVNENFKLSGDVGGVLSVYSSSGQLVRLIEKYDGSNVSTLNLTEGLFMLSYNLNGNIISKKIIIIK